MDTPNKMEQPTVLPTKINGDYRHVGFFYELEHGILPLAVGNFIGSIIARHFACREDAQSAPLLKMLEGVFNAPVAGACPFMAFERVYRQKEIADRFNPLQQKIGQHLDIGAGLRQQFNEQDAVEPAKGMVGHHDKRPFFGYLLQIGFIKFVLYLQNLQQLINKFNALFIANLPVNFIQLAKTEHIHDKLGKILSAQVGQIRTGFQYIFRIDQFHTFKINLP